MTNQLRILLSVAFIGALVGCGPSRDDSQPRAKTDERIGYLAELCKKSGIFIHEEISGVTGVRISKIPALDHNDEYQYGQGDPYGHDEVNDDYIKSLLLSYSESGSLFGLVPSDRKGFDYVDFVDITGKAYRYTGTYVDANWPGPSGGPGYHPKEFVLKKQSYSGPLARYLIMSEDISTPDQLSRWIAGGSLKIVDTATGKLVAERIGYLMDPGNGSISNGRQPWRIAQRNACPSFRHTLIDEKKGPVGQRISSYGQTRRFADLVLRGIVDPAQDGVVRKHNTDH